MADLKGITFIPDKNNVVRDRLNRPLRDLRISVTDRCNFRCVYCMPKDIFGSYYSFLPKSKFLTFEEIVRFARIFLEAGGKKIRITGGEPLLRPNLESLIEKLAGLSGLADLSLTTNGSLLTRNKARLLKDAGLNRITISLDGLDDITSARINDVGYAAGKVLVGIENAEAASLAPVKVNMVVIAGMNEHSIVPMAKFFHGSGHILRFIEYMDVGNTNDWQHADVIPASEIVARINAEMPIEAIASNYEGEVANRWRYLDGGGEIGVIASVTQPFCQDCSRIRLSTDGKIYTCLFAGDGHDILSIIRDEGVNDHILRATLASIWGKRVDRYSETREFTSTLVPKVEMSYIGG